MKVVLWIVSGPVAVFFLLAGVFKLLAPGAELADSSGGIPAALLRVAGATEVLGALGLILPAATRRLPILTPVAATGLALQVLGAIIANIAVGAYSAIPAAAILMLVLALIAWLRFGRCAVQPRSHTSSPVPSSS